MKDRKIIFFVLAVEVAFLACAYTAFQIWEKVRAERQGYMSATVTAPAVQGSLPTMQMKGVNGYLNKSYSTDPNIWNVRPVRPQLRSSNSSALFHHKTSSVTTHSYGGGQVTAGAPTTVQTTQHQSAGTQGTVQNIMPQSYAPMLTYTPTYTSTATSKERNYSTLYAVRRAPDTGGVKTQWETWLDAWEAAGHDRNDPTGLADWWYENYGEGANPNVFDDFYNYYFGVPMADGMWVLLLLMVLYLFVKNNLKPNTLHVK